MVLKIFYGSDVIPFTDIDNTFYRTRRYNGTMSLQFDISPENTLYKCFAPETELEYDGQRYLVKSINERKSISTITADIDLSGLSSKAYEVFNKKTVSFADVCKDILSGTGWSIVDAQLVAKRTSIDLKDVNPYDILSYCTNATAYNVTYKFDSINKKIYVIKPENNTTPTGTYFTDEVNMTELTYKGSSSALVTRLIPIGKDGLTIESVNNGKKYIDNNTYTDKIICQIWRDERYTNAQSLYDDAVVKLATLAVPEQTYTCKVIDLAKALPDVYGSLLSYDLYDIVTLIDRQRKTRINHRIVEIREYPANPTLNTVTLSTVAANVNSKLASVQSKVNTLDAAQLHDRTKVNEIKQDLDTTVLHVSESWASSVNESMFTQTAEGIFLSVDKIVGTNRLGTLLQQSAEDIRIAWNNISKYIKFESAQLNIYNSSDTKLMSLDSTGENIYDSTGYLLMKLDKNGQSFYYKGQYVGYIGAIHHTDNYDHRGLSFNLESSSAFMSWNHADNPDGLYTMKLTYTAKEIGSYKPDTLNTGCSLDMHNYNINNACLKNWSFEGGGITGTFSGYYVTAFNSDGTAATWKQYSLEFKNGVLQNATW